MSYIQLLARVRGEIKTIHRDNIPKAAFIYPLNSKTFNLEVWHFIITHLD